MSENRQWLLASRPVGMVAEENFELTAAPMPEAEPVMTVVMLMLSLRWFGGMLARPPLSWP